MSAETYSEKYVALVRLTMLQLLAEADGEVSLAMLKSMVGNVLLSRPSSARIEMEARWLVERGAANYRRIDGVIEAVVITDRGRDLAEGRERLTGVMDPAHLPAD